MLKRISYLILILSVVIFLPKLSCEKEEEKKSAESTLSADKEKKKTGCIEGNCTDGYGTYVHDDGSVYTGNFKDGKKHGKGTMTWASGLRKGEKYDGEWFNDKMDGQGTYTYADGSKYAGTFKDDKRHGKGTMMWASGTRKGEKYEGEWKDGKMDGKGVYTFADGSRYEGEWKDDRMDGKGIYTFADGSRYEGDFKAGKMEGKGTMTWAAGPRKGDKYTGEWKNNKMDGMGIYTFADGRIYEGKFELGKKQGHGVMKWTKGPKKGERYEGEWKNDNMDGAGTYTYPGGKKLSGQWKDGKWYGRIKATSGQASERDQNIDADKTKKGMPEPDNQIKNTDGNEINKKAVIPESLYTEYIYIQKDWKNWHLVEGGLEKLIKDKTVQIEFIDGSMTIAKFRKIVEEREIGFNRWKTYWNIETDGGVASKVPETSVWRIKFLKDK